MEHHQVLNLERTRIVFHYERLLVNVEISLFNITFDVPVYSVCVSNKFT